MVASYSSSFLKSNLVIFWASAQVRRPKSDTDHHFGLYYLLVSYFFFLYQSLSSLLCTVFHSISSNIDEILTIISSANVFVFGDFSDRHKDWLTCPGGIDRPGELCYNFSISNGLTQIVNFSTWIPDCGSHSPVLLDLFLSSRASVCSTLFPSVGEF